MALPFSDSALKDNIGDLRAGLGGFPGQTYGGASGVLDLASSSKNSNGKNPIHHSSFVLAVM
jgi:hypothetical protein